MLERTGHHVCTAAHHGLQGTRTPGEIADGDVQALFLEITQALGNGERQVVRQRLAAHGDVDVLFLERLGTGQREGKGRDAQRTGGACGLDEGTAADGHGVCLLMLKCSGALRKPAPGGLALVARACFFREIAGFQIPIALASANSFILL